MGHRKETFSYKAHFYKESPFVAYQYICERGSTPQNKQAISFIDLPANLKKGNGKVEGIV